MVAAIGDQDVAGDRRGAAARGEVALAAAAGGADQRDRDRRDRGLAAAAAGGDGDDDHDHDDRGDQRAQTLAPGAGGRRALRGGARAAPRVSGSAPRGTRSRRRRSCGSRTPTLLRRRRSGSAVSSSSGPASSVSTVWCSSSASSSKAGGTSVLVGRLVSQVKRLVILLAVARCGLVERGRMPLLAERQLLVRMRLLGELLLVVGIRWLSRGSLGISPHQPPPHSNWTRSWHMAPDSVTDPALGSGKNRCSGLRLFSERN